MVIYKLSVCLSRMLIANEHQNLLDVLEKKLLNNKA